MNFLAHLWLAGDDEGLRLGALLGDFVRGNLGDSQLPEPVRAGMLLHRFVDQLIDGLPEATALRDRFEPPFRRYSGIIIDLAFDHELALRWDEFSAVPLQQFDREVRSLVARHEGELPADLGRFMDYADRRGLFTAYREESEVLESLRGIGRRLSRPNPLHRVEEIWSGMRPALAQGFTRIFPLVRREVSAWMERPPLRQAASA